MNGLYGIEILSNPLFAKVGCFCINLISLGIKRISTLYLETHTVTHCATRLTGDQKVIHVIDNKIERESKLVRKSVTIQFETIFLNAFNLNTVQGEIPTDAAALTLSTVDPTLTGNAVTPHLDFNKDVKN